MTIIDRWIRDWRLSMASAYIFSGARILDVGSGDGALLKKMAPDILEGVGIDPEVEKNCCYGNIKMVEGFFPDQVDKIKGRFDIITMLAVLEHFNFEKLQECMMACCKLLVSHGKVILTMPQPKVDIILKCLKKLRLIDGMSLHQHHGMNPVKALKVFLEGPFELEVWRKFQLGLNNLFVLRKKVI